MDMLSSEFCEIFETKESEYDELAELVSAVEVMSDHKLYSHYVSKMKGLEIVVLKYKQIKNLRDEISEFEELQLDDESDELKTMKDKLNNLCLEIKALYAESKDVEDEIAILEFSGESQIFVSELVFVFEKYFNLKNFDFSKEMQGESVKLKVSGNNVYKKLLPFSGKIKKIFRGEVCYATLAVIHDENFDIEIKDEDLEIQTSRSGGAGGQHINKTESAVKIIHLPTGIFAECQDERSQTKNKEKAMQALLKKITASSKEKYEKNIKNQRKELKNKIFATTANVVFDFDLNKVSLSSDKNDYKLKEILEGNLDLIINNNTK